MHRALWGRGVESADQALGHLDRLLADAIAAFDLGPRPVIVDFGCGVGGTLFHLATRFPAARLVGVTVSGKQVQAARRLARNRGLADRCSFVLGDFQVADVTSSADVIVAVESFAHCTSTDAFLANAARHLRADGHLIVVDDFLTADEQALDPPQRARVQELRAGWRLPALCTMDRLVDAAARQGFEAETTEDLTPLTRPGSRVRDRLTAAVSPVLTRLGLARMPFYGNMIGGNALQVGLRGGFLRYRLLVFRKRAE
jgi:cyclopropane fatty-acyl-phospholipid synthase-like methyltransferase